MQRVPLFLEASQMQALKEVLPDTWANFLMVQLAEASTEGSIESVLSKADGGSSDQTLQSCARAYRVIAPQGEAVLEAFKAHKMCLHNPTRVYELLGLCLTARRLDIKSAKASGVCLFNSRVTHADVQCKTVVFVGNDDTRTYEVMYEKYAEFFQMVWLVAHIPAIALGVSREWLVSHSAWGYDAFLDSTDIKLLYTNYNHALTYLRMWWENFEGHVVC